MKKSQLKRLGLTACIGFGLLAAGLSASAANCQYQVTNAWGGGATAQIDITNNGASAINGWSVHWSYQHDSLSSSWNANVTGSNPYDATNLSWNASLQPGQTVSFGVQVVTSGTPEVPVISGSVCDAGSSSAPASSSSSSMASSAGSSVQSSSASSEISVSSVPASSSSSQPASSESSSLSSSCNTGAQMCNWYGSNYALCSATTSGWGWENGQSCISPSTCSNQPAPFGITGGACSASSVSSHSSLASSSSSSVVMSSSSSSISSSSSSSAAGGLTSVGLTQLMGKGWNLGNSLDAIGGETNWGNPMVTQQLIDSVSAAGFKTLRVPVAWSKFSDASNFTIDSAWMDRVEQVVNYALNDDMYVIINIHWDGGWMQPTYAQQDYVNNRLSIMWSQIASRFRDYGDHLIFAGTNEVMVDGDYGTPTVEYYSVQNSFNQTFVNAVRATGGNNANRFLAVQSFNTNIDFAVNYFTRPSDSASDKLLLEVHYYDPYDFTLNTSSSITQWGAIATDPNATETWANEAYLDGQFEKLHTNYVAKGMGVILGEFGVIARPNVSGSETYRVYYNQYLTQSALEQGVVPIYWDNGGTGDGGMGLFDRNSGAQVYPNVISAIVNAGD